jgi:hypothetical protein
VPAAAQTLGALLASAAVAQQPPSLDSRLALVRERYAAIQSARLDSSSVAYTSPGGEGRVTAFREAGGLRKVAVRFDGDGASWFLEHFYWNDSLIFVYRRWERYPESGPERTSEDRWYVLDGSLARWIRTGEDGVRRTVPPGDPEFATTAAAVLAEAACWRRFVEAGVSGEASC